MPALSVIHTIGGLGQEYGGPSRSVPALCEHLARLGARVALVCPPSRGDRGAPVLPDPALAPVLWAPKPWRWGRRLLRAPGFADAVLGAAREREAGLIHDHGLWMPTNAQAAQAARAADLPLVVSTRGMLAPSCFRHHGARKHLAWRLSQRCILERAALLHATSEAEAGDLRTLGLKTPIAVIPNGVAAPGALPLRASDDGRDRLVLYLGRLHPQKGVFRLVEAWSGVVRRGWRLILAGPDADGTRARLEKVIAARRLAPGVTIPGELDEASKWKALDRADLLVQPSDSENFGLAVAEALAMGVPAIATTGAPWEELATERCGWHVAPTEEALAQALTEAMALSDAERAAMGARGRELVRRRYLWSAVAERMLAVYRWLCQGGEAPDFVREPA